MPDQTNNVLLLASGVPTKMASGTSVEIARVKVSTELDVSTAQIVGLAATWGNVLTVDSVNGDDSTGIVGGAPYLTVGAAIAAAVSGNVIFVAPGTYNLSAGITIPAGVSITGLNHTNTIIQKLNVTADTTLVTMGVNTSIENVTLTLTSTGHYTLKGIVYPSTSTELSVVEGCDINVINSSASDGGTSNVYGIHSNGTGVPMDGLSCLSSCNIMVHSAGLGNKRGILADTAAHTFFCKDNTVMILRTGAGAGSYIGVETNFAGVTLAYRFGSITGITADISQTLGTLNIGVVTLFGSANGLGFSTVKNLNVIIWGDPGNLTSGTKYMRFGTGTAGSSEPKMRFSHSALVTNLVVRSITAPGADHTDTWTIRKNGVDTALTGSLVNTATSVVVSSISVVFAAGDDISLKVVVSSGSNLTDVQATIDYL